MPRRLCTIKQSNAGIVLLLLLLLLQSAMLFLLVLLPLSLLLLLLSTANPKAVSSWVGAMPHWLCAITWHPQDRMIRSRIHYPATAGIVLLLLLLRRQSAMLLLSMLLLL
jgi:hypothetical protein